MSEPKQDFDFQAMDEDSEDEEAKLGFKIEVRQGDEGGTVVGLRWVRGVDAVLWESFCGMVRRVGRGKDLRGGGWSGLSGCER